MNCAKGREEQTYSWYCFAGRPEGRKGEGRIELGENQSVIKKNKFLDARKGRGREREREREEEE